MNTNKKGLAILLASISIAGAAMLLFNGHNQDNQLAQLGFKNDGNSTNVSPFDKLAKERAQLTATSQQDDVKKRAAYQDLLKKGQQTQLKGITNVVKKGAVLDRIHASFDQRTWSLDQSKTLSNGMGEQAIYRPTIDDQGSLSPNETYSVAFVALRNSMPASVTTPAVTVTPIADPRVTPDNGINNASAAKGNVTVSKSKSDLQTVNPIPVTGQQLALQHQRVPVHVNNGNMEQNLINEIVGTGLRQNQTTITSGQDSITEWIENGSDFKIMREVHRQEGIYVMAYSKKGGISDTEKSSWEQRMKNNVISNQ